jgi:membrane protease subunit HflK
VLSNREELAESTLKEMQDVIDKYNSGIQLVVVQLQDLNPPDPVRPSFNEVNEAEQDKIRVSNEAQKEANTKIPKALGTAKKVIQEAEGYAIERINRAEGDVARFNAILKQYVSAKEVTRTRMYVETLRDVLPNVRDVVIIDPSKSGMVPLLNLGDALSPTFGKKK